MSGPAGHQEPPAGAADAARRSVAPAPSPEEPARPDRPRTGLLSAPVLDDILERGGVLLNGSRGYAVKVVQTALGRAGIVLRGGADGHYGPATRNAVLRFQRDHGLVPTGVFERSTLLVLDQRLQQLDRGDRSEALPAPRPLRGVYGSYLENDAERHAYESVSAELRHLRDLDTTAPEAVADDCVAVIDDLEALDREAYVNVLRALAATREKNAWAPTLLDLLLRLPAVVADDPRVRERLCAQLVAKLGGEAGERGGALNVLAHASPDSVQSLEGAPSFPALLRLLG
jgi:hypothetical protein